MRRILESSVATSLRAPPRDTARRAVGSNADQFYLAWRNLDRYATVLQFTNPFRTLRLYRVPANVVDVKVNQVVARVFIQLPRCQVEVCS